MEERLGTMRKGFRHRDTCLTAATSGCDGAAQGFREGHPDANGGTLGHSPCCSEKEWGHATGPCAGYSPAGSAWTKACIGKEPEGYGDLFLYVRRRARLSGSLKGPATIFSKKIQMQDMWTISITTSICWMPICRMQAVAWSC